ncbi:uncharacterized protein PAC_12810 [Phialocephala subalpina]|uniref:DJ-1/PfpI domain-containing protein n=1 Tax=Phialocephala subalpina TaxID=576137 RepID=A0A1L7XD17_9HELO|nr:uncharacterized protein PAC_12810 [Phialocephala subalpina]
MPTPETLKVLYHMHSDLDTLDLTGPLEILSHAVYPGTKTKVFTPTITAVSEITTTNQTLKIQRDISISEAYEKLAEYDVLIIPGGGSPGVLEGKTEPLDLIKAFVSLPKKEWKPRVLMSVCTGSLFLAEAGVLDGLQATTHPSYYGKMREILEAKAKAGTVKGTKVLEERFVVNKVDEEKGLQTITCGGVSCGLDGSLWLIQHIAGKEAKDKVAYIVQHASRDGEGIVP